MSPELPKITTRAIKNILEDEEKLRKEEELFQSCLSLADDKLWDDIIQTLKLASCTKVLMRILSQVFTENQKHALEFAIAIAKDKDDAALVNCRDVVQLFLRRSIGFGISGNMEYASAFLFDACFLRRQDLEMINISTDFGMWECQARYLLARKDRPLWLAILDAKKNGNGERIFKLIPDVICKFLSSQDIKQIEVMSGAFYSSKLFGELVTILECVLKTEMFEGSHEVQSMLAMTALRGDFPTEMRCKIIKKLEHIEFEKLAKISEDAELYEEAWFCLDKCEKYQEAIMLLFRHYRHVGGMSRIHEYGKQRGVSIQTEIVAAASISSSSISSSASISSASISSASISSSSASISSPKQQQQQQQQQQSRPSSARFERPRWVRAEQRQELRSSILRKREEYTRPMSASPVLMRKEYNEE